MTMPVVIDLLSSPELPVKKAKPADTSASTRKVLDYNDNNDDDDVWHRLSSDGPSLPVSRPRPSTTIAESANSAKPKPKSNDKDSSSSHQLQHNNDFVYLSDDFDSTVNFSDPFATDLPPPKKRRVSSSPQATTSKEHKAGGYKRSVSNIETIKTTITSRPGSGSAAVLKKSKSMATVPESDPIVLTSSPDVFAEATKKRKAPSRNYEDEVVDDDEFDVFELDPKRKSASRSNLSKGPDIENSSDFDFPDIGDIPIDSLSKGDARAAVRKYNAEKTAESKSKSQTKSQTTTANAPKVSEEDKLAAKEGKLAAKEAEKEKKRIAREEKVAAKEREKEFAKVNVVRTDKKNSTPEMIVDLPSCLDVKLRSHVKALLEPVKAELDEWESDISLIKWRRKVESIYDEKAGHFVVCPKHIKQEMHIMYVMNAKEFVSLATGPEGKDLDAHFLRLKAKYDGYAIIYLIEGLMPWMRKNKGVKNAQFQEAVRNMGAQEEDSTQQRKKAKKQAEYIDEDLVEDALLRLQVVHKPLIHHTNAAVETGQWVVAFTQHISTVPYRKLKDGLDTTFSMESGQVKTGEDAADTYLRMLSELKMITAPVACGIAAEFPTVQKLVAGLQSEGPLVLQDCRKTANKDGALTDKRVGPAISRRVHRVFTGRDQWEVV